MPDELKELLILLSDIEHSLQMIIQSNDPDMAEYESLGKKSDETRAKICNWTDENLRT